MMEYMLEDYCPWFSVDTSKGNREISNDCLNISTEELPQAEGYQALFEALEDELVEVGCFLAEPQNTEFIESILGFDSVNMHKCFDAGGLSAAEYSYIKTNGVSLASNLVKGENVEDGVADRKLDETTKSLSEGIDSLPDICVDDLLEIPTDDAICDQKSSLLDRMTNEELHGTFRNMFGRDAVVTDKQWLKRSILFGLQNFDVLDDGSRVTGNCTTSKSGDSERGMVLSTGGECSTEDSDPLISIFKFRTKPRVRNVKRSKQLCYDYLKRFSLEINKLAAMGLTESRVVRKKRSRKPRKTSYRSLMTRMWNYREHGASSDEGFDGLVHGKRRRNHHIVWSVTEVSNLVEGVSRYGVGRWSEIKKKLFPPPSCRTSVDLKDKWRNLLAASIKESQGNLARASQTIPGHILRRVKELSIQYPYPRPSVRQRNLTKSQSASVYTRPILLLPLSTPLTVWDT